MVGVVGGPVEKAELSVGADEQREAGRDTGVGHGFLKWVWECVFECRGALATEPTDEINVPNFRDARGGFERLLRRVSQMPELVREAGRGRSVGVSGPLRRVAPWARSPGSAERVSGARSGPGTSAGLRQRESAGALGPAAASGRRHAARPVQRGALTAGRVPAAAERPAARPGRCSAGAAPAVRHPPRRAPHPPGKSAVVRLVWPAAGGGGAPARAAGAPRSGSCRPADTGCQRRWRFMRPWAQCTRRGYSGRCADSGYAVGRLVPVRPS